MDLYSRFVAWLKVLLPLTALALLSTLFLLSRNTTPIATLPFAASELSDRVRAEQITGPFFSGTSDRGDQVRISADTMRTGQGEASTANALSAQIDLISGTRVNIVSDTGSFDLAAAKSILTGNVVVTTSMGYILTTDSLDADFNSMTLQSPFTQATGPLGEIEAGQMRITQKPPGNATQFIFTDGVKLVYTPTNRDE